MKKQITILSVFLLTTLVSFGQTLDRSKRPEPGPARTPKIAKYQEFSLPNGLKVFVVENHKLPKVSFSVVLDTDPIIEGDKAGYTSLVGDLIKAGTKTKTKEQLNEEVDFMGASLAVSAGSVYASSLSKYKGDILALMADVIKNPAMPAEEFEKLKKQLLSGAKSQKDDPNAISTNLFGMALYGKDHSYGEFMSEKTVENISLEECTSYYNTYFRPNVAYMAIVGDITLKEAKALVTKHFSDWKKGEVPTHEVATTIAKNGTRVVMTDRAASVQTVIKLGNPILLKKDSPDYFAAKVANQILGGGSLGRLFKNLREDKAYTYGAYSGASDDEYIGRFAASAEARTEVTDSAITQFIYEINKIRTEKVSDKNLQDAKNYLAGSFGRSLESPQTVASFALNVARYNLTKDYYNTYLTKLAAVTVDDVMAAAKKYFDADNMTIALVGKGADMEEKLKQFDADGEIEFFDTDGNKTELVRMRPAPAGVTCEDIFNQKVLSFTQSSDMKTAMKKLKKLKSVTTKAGMAVQGMAVDMVTYKKASKGGANKIAVNIMFQGQVVQKQVFNGTTGVSKGMQGKKEMEGDELVEMKMQADFTSELNLAKYGYTAELVGIEEINGTDAYVVKLKKGEEVASTNYYSVETGLAVKSVSEQEGPEGEKVVAISETSNYKEVDGFLFPFFMKQDAGGQKFDIEVSSITVNDKLGDELFQ